MKKGFSVTKFYVFAGNVINYSQATSVLFSLISSSRKVLVLLVNPLKVPLIANPQIFGIKYFESKKFQKKVQYFIIFNDLLPF